MNNQYELIQQIDLLKDKFCYHKFNDDETAKIALSLYDKLSEDNKKYVERSMYDFFRYKLSESLTCNDFQGMKNWYEKLEINERFENELEDNKSQILSIGIFGYQILNLENKDREYIPKINKLFKSLENIYKSKYSNIPLYEKICKLKDFFKGSTKIFTNICVELPLNKFPYYLTEKIGLSEDLDFSEIDMGICE